jgi:carbon starvation protein
MNALADQIGEKTLFGRVGGAPTLAVGMATIFSRVFQGQGLGLWYHFAIMFEALFILTTLDAGTRVGRYLLQDFLGHVWKPLGDTKHFGANVLASGLMVSAWGYFLIQGVRDPLGGINSLWPLFGIANQMLAAIALCLAVTIILKMQLQPEKPGKPALALIALVPLVWLLTATVTAGVQKIWHPDPRIGFLAQAEVQSKSVQAAKAATNTLDEAAHAKAAKEMKTAIRLYANQIIDAIVAGVFLILVSAIVLLSLREWILLLTRKKTAALKETSPVWLPDYAAAEPKPLNILGPAALAFALAKELSGEAEMKRAQTPAESCACIAAAKTDKQIYVETTEKRFNGVTRCC